MHAGRLGAIALVAGLTFVAGVSSPYPAVADEGIAPVAPPTSQVEDVVPTPAADARLDAAAIHLDRLTRLLRNRQQGEARDDRRLAQDVQAQLEGLRGLELVLDASARGERAWLDKQSVDDAILHRFDGTQAEARKRAQAFRPVAARFDAAYRSGDIGEMGSAMDAMADFLADTDATRRPKFDPESLRAQRVEREARDPATSRRALDRFLAARSLPKATLVDPNLAPTASFMATTAAAAPTPELTASHETRITPEIQALADALDRNPVRIFNWVRNEIDYVPTHGAIQGASLTLRSRRGNAADVNSLLASLYRAAGIPVRFVYGTVDVPVARAVNWLKARDFADAVRVIEAGGIPGTIIKIDGQVAALRMQHLWVEANIDFTPSRGVVNRTPDAWIPLDASYKQFERSPVLDFLALAQWDGAQAAAALKNGAEINADGSMTGLNFTDYQAYEEAAIDRIVQATDADVFDPAKGEGPGSYRIVRSELPVITGTLPFAVGTATARFAAIPDSLKFFVEANLYRAANDIAYENPEFAVRMATVDLDGQSLYVDYAPETDADAAGINAYAQGNAASMPLGSFRVVPKLMLGTQVVAQGGGVGMGTQQFWTVGIRDMQGRVQGVFEPYRFAAGSRIAFTPDLGGMNEALLGSMLEGVPDNAELPIAQALHLAGVQYWALNDSSAKVMAENTGGHFVRMPSVGAFAAPLNVRYFFGIPRTGSFNGYQADVKADRIALAHATPAESVRLAAQIGASGSMSEGLTWDLLFGGKVGQALSSSSILVWANRNHVPIHTLTAENVDALLPRIETTSDVKAEIRDAVAAGYRVIIPEKEYRQAGVQAAGYVMLDPDTGTGIYRVDGGLNGAIRVDCIAVAVVLTALCKMKFMKLLQQRLVTLFARMGGKRLIAQRILGAVLPPLGIAMLILDAVIITLTIIQVAHEIEQWVRAIENGIETLSPEDLAALGIKSLNNIACSYVPGCFGALAGGINALRDEVSPSMVPSSLGDTVANGPYKGNPVSIGNGAKTQVETDYAGEGPFPLSYTRTYLSYLPNGSTTGHKWLATYFQSLKMPGDTTAMTAPTGVLTQRSDGGWSQYTLRAGAYVAKGDQSEALSRVTDGLGRTTAWRLKTREDLVETYDAGGRLLTIENRAGLKHTLAYDADGNLERVSDDFGRSLRFEYDAESGQVAAMIDPESRRTTYAYEEGALVLVTRADQTTRRYHYEMPRWPTLLTGITDERGVRFATWKYDEDHRTIESTHAGGADRHTFRYGLDTTAVTDPLGTVRTYTFTRIDDTMYMTSVTEPCGSCGAGGSAKVEYDGNGYPTLLTDFNGNKTQLRTNARGLPEQWTQALGTPDARTISVQWHPTWRLPTQITEPAANGGARVTTLQYDARGALEKRTVTAGGESRVWVYANNVAGQVTRVDGPRNDVADVTSYTYDAEGNRATETDANGLETRYSRYDASGNVLQAVDASGLKTDYTYDERNRLVEAKVTPPDGAAPEITTFAYTAFGAMERVTFPDGTWMQYAYDDAHRVQEARDSRGNRVSTLLDPAGHRIKTEKFGPDGALATTQHRVMNALGQVERIYGDDPAGATVFGYDANGNERTVLEPLHAAAVEHRYDAIGRLTGTRDPSGRETTYRFDAQDDLTEIVDARGLATRHSYGGHGEIETITSPDTGVTRYSYDAAGNRVSQRDARDIVATLRYDAGNRLAGVTYPDESIGFVYDEVDGGAGAKGRLTTVSDGSGRTRLAYDGVGRIAQVTQQLGADTNASARKTVGYTYGGGLLRETLLPSGARIGYRYGSDGRVLEITVNGQVIVREVEYLPFGDPKSWATVAGNYNRAYDQDGRVVAHTRGPRTAQLRYDLAGRLATMEEGAQDRPAWRYGYDDLDRLTQADNAAIGGPLANSALAWQYDATGNRALQTRNGATTSYVTEATSNRLASVESANRQYDAAGNSVLVDGDTYVYSGRNRLVEVRRGAIAVARYAYNGLGARVCVASAGGTCPTNASSGSGYQQFVYDQQGHLIGEYDTAGNLLAEHVWLGEVPVAVLKPAGSAAGFGGQPAGSVVAFFVHPDHLDTPRAIVNAGGNLVWRWDSEPFGETLAVENPEGLGTFAYRLRFPGQQFDATTGTHYNFARDYDPKTGRFLESDPTGLEDGPNPYAYVAGRPLDVFDPDGEAGSWRPKWWKSVLDALKLRSKGRCEKCEKDFGAPHTGDGPENHHRGVQWHEMRDMAVLMFCIVPDGPDKAKKLRRYQSALFNKLSNLWRICENCHDDEHGKKRRYDPLK